MIVSQIEPERCRIRFGIMRPQFIPNSYYLFPCLRLLLHRTAYISIVCFNTASTRLCKAKIRMDMKGRKGKRFSIFVETSSNPSLFRAKLIGH